MEITVPIPVEAERDRDAIAKMVPQVVVMAVELQRERRAAVRRDLVEMFLEGVTPRRLDITMAKMEAAAYRAMLGGTEWLTAPEIGELAGLGQGNPAATVNRWKKERKIFAIRRDGNDFYPRYALGPDFRPLPALAEVLKVLQGYSGERLATWFESTSAFLEGKRPREILQAQPQRVLAAAQDKVDAELFAG